VICQHANNEIGTVQPVGAIGQWCQAETLAFLVDAVQTAGHLPVDVRQLCCDFLLISAHKFYGPKGAGVLYNRQHRLLKPWILGGDQERGLRSGTVNVAQAVGLAKALRMAHSQLAIDANHDQVLRDFIIEEVLKNIEGVSLNGDRQQRLLNNVHVSIQGIDSEQLITALDMRGIAVSMGSACSAGRLTPSHVLKAIDLSDAQALAALRVTVGRHTCMDEVRYFCAQLREVVGQLRKTSHS
jgi:cysteine desulfurase